MNSLYIILLSISVTALAEEGWVLQWEDEFDKLDYNNWQHEITAWGGGNQEFQVYTNDPRNSYVRDGVLYLKPTLTTDKYGPHVFENGSINLYDYGYCSLNNDWGCYREKQDIPPIMSARLRTFDRFSFKYGKVVIDAKMPAGDWLWPAMWLLPENWEYGPWPLSGEIDIVETIGNRDLRRNSDGKLIGVQHMGSALHWGPRWDVNKFDLTNRQIDDPDRNYADYFHQYELEWNEEGLVTRVDGVEVLAVPSAAEQSSWNGFWEFGMQNGGMGDITDNPWTQGNKMAPFDQAFHLILNVAVGGTNGFIPDDATNAGGSRPKPWRNGVGQKDGQIAFWADKDNWYPTWEGEEAAMQVRSVRVYQRGTIVPSTTPGGPTDGSTQVTVSLTLLASLVFLSFFHNRC